LRRSGKRSTGATAAPVAIDNDDIGGTVNGPGVARSRRLGSVETQDLLTRYAKIVVTDDRALCGSDLPDANYQIWFRGYGLVDSDESGGLSRADAGPHRECCAVAGRGRHGLSGGVLVLDDEGTDR
jgi:hypothetical protein